MLELEARVVFLSYPEGIPIEVMPKLIPCFDDPWVDLDIAQTEFERDTRRCEVLLSDKPPLEDLSKIHRALRKWNWFWAYQHPNEWMREYFRREAEAGDMEAEIIRLKVEAMLAKRGILMLPRKDQ
jgi:hypothetical protein